MNEFMAFTDYSWSLGLLGLVVAGFIYGYVKKQPRGTDLMIDLEQQIHDGSMAFLRREYIVLAVFVAIVAVLLGFAIGRQTALAYVGGALCSVCAGFFGMKAATRANVRTAAAAYTDGAG